MYIIAVAWGFVVVLMAAAEAMSTSVVGGLLTLIFCGALPMSIFFYIFGSGQRRRDRARRESLAQHAAEPPRADQPPRDEPPPS